MLKSLFHYAKVTFAFMLSWGTNTEKRKKENKTNH